MSPDTPSSGPRASSKVCYEKEETPSAKQNHHALPVLNNNEWQKFETEVLGYALPELWVSSTATEQQQLVIRQGQLVVKQADNSTSSESIDQSLQELVEWYEQHEELEPHIETVDEFLERVKYWDAMGKGQTGEYGRRRILRTTNKSMSDAVKTGMREERHPLHKMKIDSLLLDV